MLSDILLPFVFLPWASVYWKPGMKLKQKKNKHSLLVLPKATCFQNHRTTGWKCLLEACQSASSQLQQDYCQCQVRMTMALSCCTLEASKEGGAGTSPDSLLQCCTNLLKKIFSQYPASTCQGRFVCRSLQEGEEDAGSASVYAHLGRTASSCMLPSG